MPDIRPEQQVLAIEAIKSIGRLPAHAAFSDLIAALHHLADARGFDFAELLNAAQRSYRTHLNEASEYKIGDEVRLLRRPNESGTVVRQVTNAPGTLTLHVHVPGAPHLRAISPDQVEPAAPFPVVGEATTAGKAELEAIALLASARRARQAPPPEAHALIAALATWSGRPVDQVATTLDPKVDLYIASSPDPRGPATRTGPEAAPSRPRPALRAVPSPKATRSIRKP
ncbi:hypothetical protein EDD29_5763 [Actinocorallia herbida]|uniref:Uncharacterized protein n=1 Tax=Actinocorallia herbida TaxID=58109 RepID=A0A3N1D3K3_9ACTN|nr:hypothetical protein [Actinocorallia herbida]ROO88105.1 hypothetical protein EDD29_5763 [Actinocorallia herbida]